MPRADDILDATDLLCPLPVLKARKALNAMTPGQKLRIRTSDPVAVIDIPHFCAEAGHRLISSTDEGATQLFEIERG
ncbi:sulfurtransferase TusA family protein [Pseudooceanicola sp.]|uniref:sulfurtransferase TusA family protein n=1 Tax=Pseudooceanicola sp. TaxID=1914328 RepID=UPI002614F6D0|nr:sulfurtransferase TusA family protein [Pseudooceanicola sp.]MDF1854056.1 sulfurtransferase TusA family protein [Pseudooceanicola sp.]